jgi:predicted MPP superfamily phosphohydrolase
MLLTLIYDSVIAIVVGAVPTYFAVTVVRKRRHKGSGPGIIGALLALVWLVVVYGSFIEPRLLQVGRTSISIGEGSRSLRVALISDTHLGQYRHREWLETVVARINALKPDIVLVGGDIASAPAGYEEFQPFAKLQSTFGTYAVLGNWDYRAGAVDVRKRLGSYKVKLLVNKSVPLEVDGQKISLIGLDDVEYGQPDIDVAMKDVPPDAKKILMVHNPDATPLAETRGIDLVLAGHTHAGQVRLPFLGPVPNLPITIGQQFDKGYFPFGQTRLFITPGVGESGTRARFFDPPEISFVTITF